MLNKGLVAVLRADHGGRCCEAVTQLPDPLHTPPGRGPTQGLCDKLASAERLFQGWGCDMFTQDRPVE